MKDGSFHIQSLSSEIFLRHILSTLKSQRNQSPANASFAASRRRRLAAAAIVGGVAVQTPGAHCAPRRRGVGVCRAPRYQQVPFPEYQGFALCARLGGRRQQVVINSAQNNQPAGWVGVEE